MNPKDIQASSDPDLAGSFAAIQRAAREKEALIAALKIIALGEKDRLENKGLTIEESRAQLRAARERRK